MVQPISETVRILKQETLEATKALLVRTAREEHAKIMADLPAPTSFLRIVDGRLGAGEASVKPDGVIIYQYRRLDEVVRFAMETLFDLSPVLSGDYRSAHTIVIDGIAAADLKGYRSGSEIAIFNPLPYSRKIEVGKMTMRVAGSSKVYQQARRKIMSRYGNIVSVEYKFRAFLGGIQVDQAKATSSGASWWLGHDGAARAASGVNESIVGKRHGKTAHNRPQNRFPTIIIKER